MAKHKIKNNDTDTITVIIPAAGTGRRMKTYGPKPMINIGKKTILQRQIDIIKEYFKSVRFIIVTGFESDKLIQNSPKDFIKLENELYKETNVARSVSIALNAVESDRVLVLMGDLVFSKEAIGMLDYNSSCTSASIDSHREAEVGCIISKNGVLLNMMYDLELKWNQIVYLQGKELKLFKEACTKRRNKKLFLFEIMNKVIDKGGKIKCIINDKIKVIDVDNSKDLLKIKEII
ncbi:MAG TPA: hypothetical protein DCM10_07345 [Xanthomarina gelatinilytica]|nr:hypothetical protein [Xanthomarina gelatinilytica]|tara:strand:+ start:908 stop:1609 length:702 start_codon:yes stop_codon:yes gene_type:complete